MNTPMNSSDSMSRFLRIPCLLAFSFGLALAGCATDLQQASSPASIGLSSDRLNEVSAAFRTGVEKKEIPGAVVLIARHGRIGYFEAFGYRDRETGAPMNRDAIFRIASMSKPVTIVAAMTLVEQGRLSLSVPVSKYLPEFKNVKVGVEKKDASGELVLELETPHREMTVLDLMRHTSGLTYGFTGKSLVRDQYNRLKVSDPSQSNADFVTKIS